MQQLSATVYSRQRKSQNVSLQQNFSLETAGDADNVGKQQK